jgi:hypothetical protein
MHLCLSLFLLLFPSFFSFLPHSSIPRVSNSDPQIFYIQHHLPEVKARDTSARALCYAKQHDLSYSFIESRDLLKSILSVLQNSDNFTHVINFRHLVPNSYTPRDFHDCINDAPKRWRTILEILVALSVNSIDTFHRYFSTSSHKASSHYDWVLYTDDDCTINNSSLSVLNFLNQILDLHPNCFFIAQDYDHIIDSGFFLFRRNSLQSIQFLHIWIEQWCKYKDRGWVGEQGYLQEAALIYLSQLNPNLYPYTPHTCRLNTAHKSNLCYRQVLKEWEVRGPEGVIKEGICLISQTHPQIAPFNRHNRPLAVLDLFLHFDELSQVNQQALIRMDPHCHADDVIRKK